MVVGIDLRMIGMLLLWAILTRLDRRQCDIVCIVWFGFTFFIIVDVVDVFVDELSIGIISSYCG